MIIDFTEYKYGTKLNMTLSDDSSDVHVSATVEEILWAPNRTLPFNIRILYSTQSIWMVPYLICILLNFYLFLYKIYI